MGIKGKTPEEIRQTFNIVNDFTPEEENKCAKKTSGAKKHKSPGGCDPQSATTNLYGNSPKTHTHTPRNALSTHESVQKHVPYHLCVIRINTLRSNIIEGQIGGELWPTRLAEGFGNPRRRLFLQAACVRLR